MKQIKKIINGNQIEIKVYSGKRSRSESDREMDERAKSAVKAAINKAKVCKQPVARYDTEKRIPYLEYPNGEIVYGK